VTLLRRMMALAVVAIAMSGVLAACGTPVALRTAAAKADGCDMAVLAGELVASNQSGLAIRDGDELTEVIWPFGYSAARETGGIVLRDDTGKVVGHEGQRVEVGGGLGANGVWAACGAVTEVSNTGG
jgi:hypothetical protein